jgi:hypothetical protein
MNPISKIVFIKNVIQRSFLGMGGKVWEMGNLKLEMGNLKLEMGNLKLGMDNLKLGMDNLKLGMDNLKLGMGNLKLGFRNLNLLSHRNKISIVIQNAYYQSFNINHFIVNQQFINF